MEQNYVTVTLCITQFRRKVEGSPHAKNSSIRPAVSTELKIDTRPRGYLPSHRASLTFDWYQSILPTCAQ